MDDKPNVLDKADVLPDGFYRIWCTTTFTHIHVWGDGDYTNYNDNSGLLKTDVATGKKYFDIQVSSTWNPKTVRYLFHTDNDKTDDLVINFGEWRRVTGKSYAYEVYK